MYFNFLYLRNKIFPKYKIYAWTQQIIKIFTIEQIQWKLMTKFFCTFKKPYFWPISPIFWAKKVFPKKSGCHSQRQKGFWHHVKIQRILMIQFQENTQTGGKDRQTLFHRVLLATTRSLTSTIAVNWHLKVKNIEYDIGLTKNCCITVSMQKISSIQKLIQQILGSHVLNGLAYFWPHPPKNHWNNL